LKIIILLIIHSILVRGPVRWTFLEQEVFSWIWLLN